MNDPFSEDSLFHLAIVALSLIAAGFGIKALTEAHSIEGTVLTASGVIVAAIGFRHWIRGDSRPHPLPAQMPRKSDLWIFLGHCAIAETVLTAFLLFSMTNGRYMNAAATLTVALFIGWMASRFTRNWKRRKRVYIHRYQTNYGDSETDLHSGQSR